MKYQQKRFTLPAVEKPPEKCDHGWLTPKGLCVFCGFDQGLLVEQMRHELTKTLRKVRADIYGSDKDAA